MLGEFLGELNASHTYHGGGDQEEAPQRSVGMLGVDWELANGAYRIRRIIRGGPWDSGVRSPFDEPGVNVKDGEYVLAVNGAGITSEGKEAAPRRFGPARARFLSKDGAPMTIKDFVSVKGKVIQVVDEEGNKLPLAKIGNGGSPNVIYFELGEIEESP